MEKNMNKIFILLFILVLPFVMAGCGRNDGKPVVKTITTKAGSSEKEYTLIYENGKGKATEEFAADDALFLLADQEDFSSEIENGKITVRLNGTKLTDADGNPYEADKIINSLMQCVAETAEHDLVSVTILIDDGTYFVFEEWNVNWQSPCVLYQYDTEAGALKELYRWDDVKLQGISLAAERSGS